MYEVKVREKTLAYPGWNNDYTKQQQLNNDCSEVCSLLAGTIKNIRRDFIRAGYLLRHIRETKLYEIAKRNGKSFQTYGDSMITNRFEKFCKEYFGLSDSTVYALISVAEKFGDNEGVVNPTFEQYNYSQLSEMTSLPEELLGNVTPDMTVAQIRKLKKKQKAPKEQSEEEPVEALKEQPNKPVSKYVFENYGKKKEDFKKYCKYYFEAKNVLLYIGGEKVGGQAFGAKLFEYLELKGYFDRENLETEQPSLLSDL